MNHMDDLHIDDVIRLSLSETDDVLEAASARSRAQFVAPTSSAARPTRRRRVARARIALVGVVAVAASVAVALLPGSGDPARMLPSLPQDATAAEALAWAGSALEVSGAGAGTGDVWHAVSRSHRDGSVERISEVWLEEDGQHRLEFGATDMRARVEDRSHGVGYLGAYRAEFDGEVERLRAYDADEEAWRVSRPPHRSVRGAGGRRMQFPNFLQSDVPGGRSVRAATVGGPPGLLWDRNGRVVNQADQDPAKHPVRRVAATVSTGEAVHRWVRAVAAADQQEDLVRATYVYLRTTRGEFHDGDLNDRNVDAQRWTTIRQLVRLLQVARVDPAATRAIYGEFASLDQLTRLADVEVDGRPAIRIRTYQGDISNSILELADPEAGDRRVAEDEVVLVIDRETGALLRTESADRTRFTEFLPAQRVEAIGSEPVACGDDAFGVPCELVRNEGPLADQAAREAMAFDDPDDGFEMSSPYAGRPYLGELDEDGLPLDDYDEPITYPSTPDEAKERGYDYMSCSMRPGTKLPSRILYPNPNRYCEPLYPLAELPGR